MKRYDHVAEYFGGEMLVRENGEYVKAEVAERLEAALAEVESILFHEGYPKEYELVVEARLYAEDN